MKKMIRTVVAVILAAVIIVLLKNQYGSVFAGNTYGMPAAIEKGEIDYLFIGSSMFRQGLDIDVLEEHLDGSVYILSYNGNQPVFMAEELEYMLEHGLQVKKLFIDFYAFTLTAVPWISDTKMFLDTDLSFKKEAWKIMATHNEVKFSDFYEMFVTANNEQILMFPVNNAVVSSQFRNGGSLMSPAGQTKEHLDSLDLGVREELFESQLEGYEKILELCGKYNIELLFIETPKYEKLMNDTRTGAYPELVQQMKNWAEKQGAGYVLADEVQFEHADPENFQDLIHLSGQGRRTYCEKLCELLKN